MGSKPYLVVDTGGFEPVAKDGILRELARQTEQAIAEADVVVFLVDVRSGLTAHDYDIANLLRRSAGHVVLAVNNAEGRRHDAAGAEVYDLGLGPDRESGGEGKRAGR